MTLRVIPRAERDRVQGVQGDALKVRLQAPPVDNRANAALVRLLAGLLDVPAGRLTLLAGASGRHKKVRVLGVSKERAEQALLSSAGS